ncbi:hypothetical protein VP01_592g10 [Puccinia sorghi]|uniref:No apical meristem-associated C-terminal domain-containing protein n=1 Tax=Puccinia sorghi TaxID=27349 RepID=A0A0L6UHP1_9BASI|nr:hypothetical protein VP01_592g10 [Puccinia sorghi]
MRKICQESHHLACFPDPRLFFFSIHIICHQTLHRTDKEIQIPSSASTSTPNIPQPCIPASTSETPLSRQKQAPISWEKDGPEGTSSIRIILEWLAVDRNYQRWQGDNMGGATKSTLAAGILAEMVDAGITHRDTKAALTKMCRYWDVLHPIMGARTCANPPVKSESTSLSIPNLLSRNDNSPPADQQTTCSKAVGDSLGLEQVLNDSYKYWLKCFEACERREALKLVAENKQARIDSILEKRKLRLEARRMRLIEMEAQVIHRAEMDEVHARIGFIKELRDLGWSQEDIERFLSEQYSQGEGPSNPPPPDNESSEGEDSFNNDENPITL